MTCLPESVLPLNTGVSDTPMLISHPSHPPRFVKIYSHFLFNPADRQPEKRATNKHSKTLGNNPNYHKINYRFLEQITQHKHLKWEKIFETQKKHGKMKNAFKVLCVVLTAFCARTRGLWRCSLSFINKTEWMKTVVGNVCGQHVRAPCSLHLRAFPAIRIVFCYNNGSAVYPRGDFGVQIYKVTPPSSISHWHHRWTWNCICRGTRVTYLQ